METSPRSHRPVSDEPQPDQAARLAALNARAARPPSFPSDPASPPRTAQPAPRRRHAARGARATALGLSLASTGALAALFAFTSGQTSGGNQVAAASIVTTSATSATTIPSVAPSTPSTTVAAAAKTVPATTVPSASATAATTVVDGAVYHNKWGDVQVEATFAADGSLVDVTMLQTPYVDGKSVRINERAVPQLNSEALIVQNANVDTISGATYTSTDYRHSLQSAIDAANAAGITTIA